MAMNNAQYEAIMRTYDQTRMEHKRMQHKRTLEVYDKIPAFQKLDQQVPSVSASYARARIMGENASLSELQKELSNIAIEKETLLVQNGFPKDYLELQYTCGLCMDTGYIDGNKCSCLKNRLLSVLYEQSNIADMLSVNNFDHLSTKYYEGEDLQRFENAAALCKNLVDEFDTKRESLLLFGDVGVGKSFLSCCVAKALLDKGYSVLYFSASHLFDVLAEQDFQKDSKENLYTSKEDIYNCDLVIIDDLGTELVNSYIFTSFFALINERLLRKKSTIISSNLSLSELRDVYTDRIFSRISTTYKVCKLSGPDIRIKKQLK